jgi:hypothetical protein
MPSSCFSFRYREDAQATSTACALSTAMNFIHRELRTSLRNHNAATLAPNSRPNRGPDSTVGRESKKGIAMTKQSDSAAIEREEIAARVAHFKATQEKFERAREEYFVATLENARHSDNARDPSERPSFWS